MYIHNISIYYPGKTRCSMIFWNQKSGLHLLGIFWGRKHHCVRRSMSQPIWPAIFSSYSQDVPFPLPCSNLTFIDRWQYNIYIYHIFIYPLKLVMFVEFPWLCQDKERLISKYLAQETSRYIFHSYIISGWWYTYPSEKYEFVSWDDSAQYMEK